MSEAKTNILFVDDEQAVLQGLRRMLRPFRDEWNMTFVESGTDALEFMTDHPCDVIVTDMMMPEMDGTQLLIAVQERFPAVVRIVLSGQASRESVMKSVEPTHQYLSKPCNADKLRSVISRACALRSLLQDDAVQKIVASVTRIPSLPSVYTEVSRALSNDDIAVEEIGKIISEDVAMTAKLLKCVNSSYFGTPRKVDSAGQAASILGTEMLRSLVLSVGVFSQFEHLSCPGFSIDEFGLHSHRVGMLAKAIASSESDDKFVVANAFLAGFMHDIGKLILIENLSDDYVQILQSAARNKRPLHEEELAVLRASHAGVGAYLLGIWGLPEEIVEAIAFHHAPSELPLPVFGALTAVHTANAIDHELNGKDQEGSSALDLAYLETLGLASRLDEWRTLAQSIVGESS